MNIYDVWFDYEEEDIVQMNAKSEQDAMEKVADLLLRESDYDGMTKESIVDSLNANLILENV